MDRLLRWLARLTPLVVLSLTSTGCATITGGGREQAVKITSQPSGATVLVDGQPQGTTPVKICLNRHQQHLVQVEMSGYETYQALLKTGVNPWIFGNLLFGGIVGLVVDVCAEANHRLFPGSVCVRLRRLGKPPEPDYPPPPP
jgi:hypothetical protein